MRIKLSASCKANPRYQSDEKHIRAKIWHVRTPSGVGYHFKNLTHFVRTHRHLFTEAQLAGTPATGLAKLNPNNRYARSSWFGWTWASIHERRFNDGDDLLNRKENAA
jgi:hypothetical protein